MFARASPRRFGRLLCGLARWLNRNGVGCVASAAPVQETPRPKGQREKGHERRARQACAGAGSRCAHLLRSRFGRNLFNETDKDAAREKCWVPAQNKAGVWVDRHWALRAAQGLVGQAVGERQGARLSR